MVPSPNPKYSIGSRGKSQAIGQNPFSHFLAGCLWQVIYLFNLLICKLSIPTTVGCWEIKVCLAFSQVLRTFLLNPMAGPLKWDAPPWCCGLRSQDRQRDPLCEETPFFGLRVYIFHASGFWIALEAWNLVVGMEIAIHCLETSSPH